LRQILKDKLTFTLKYSVGIVLLIWILSRVNRQDLVATFLNLTFADILFVLVIAFINLSVQFRLWKFLVESHSQNFDLKDLLPSFFAGFAFRLIIPGGHAEVTKVFLLRGKKKGKVIAFGIEKFFQTFLKIVLVLFAIPFVFPEYGVLLFILGTLVVIGIFILPLILKKERFSKHQEKEVSYSKIFLLSFAHSVPMFLCIAVQYYYLLSLTNDITLLQVVIVTVFAWGAGVIPISVSGLGVRENLVVFFLAQYSVSGAEAVAISLFVFFVNSIIPAVVGVFVILKRRHDIKEAGTEIKKITKSVYEKGRQKFNGKQIKNLREESSE
jgi:glycosyltransferase 2 family protein